MENVASRFGQRLAHTEKKYRDQALKKLTAYLTKRAEWSDLEWDKLWKALFYCMWMSDKRPIQDELAANLAALVHKMPSEADALGFVHSFFRTMHREWHGIDGLRLDKFYSLIRKFVYQTLLLLQNHEWRRELVEQFVSIVSSEIMSQLPNGLRLHVTDLFLTELHGAAGETVDTETFLLLLEPFFTLLSSEYDKIVFKRVRELVFLPMLSTYKFGPQPPKKAKKKSKSENGETDEEDAEEEEEEDKVFEEVDVQFVQHRIFEIASADDTAERNRSVLYDLYSHFFKATKIDSFKANQDASLKPKKSEKKRKQPEPEAAEEGGTDEEPKKKKKNKRRKKSKSADADAEMAEEPEKEVAEEEETPVTEAATEATTPEKKKKGKKEAEASKTPVNTPVKVAEETPTKKQKKAKTEAEDVVMEAAKALESTPESAKKSKKDKKKAEAEAAVEKEETPSKKAKKDKKKAEEAAAVEEVPTPSKKEKKAAEAATPAVKKEAATDSNIVVRSGIKFQRCACCGGLGKGLVPKGKNLCRHCERTGGKPKSAAAKQPAASKSVKSENVVKSEKSDVVVRSGMKFRRCGGCGGLGKGLVPAGKDFCRHCERTGQQKKKELTADKKKRKAEVLAAAAADEEVSAPSKKVTFGKNRALAHELSVKRLKASKTVVKELTSDIKGVLKPGSTPPTSGSKSSTKAKKAGGRMKAADFF